MMVCALTLLGIGSTQAAYVADFSSASTSNDFQYASIGQVGVSGTVDVYRVIQWDTANKWLRLYSKYDSMVSRVLIKSDDGSGLNDGKYTGTVYASIAYNYNNGGTTTNAGVAVAVALKNNSGVNNYPSYYARVRLNKFDLVRHNSYDSTITTSSNLPVIYSGNDFRLELRATQVGGMNVDLVATLSQSNSKIAELKYSDTSGYLSGYVGFMGGDGTNTASFRGIDVTNFVVNVEPQRVGEVVSGLYSPGGAGVVGSTNVAQNLTLGGAATLQIDVGASSQDVLTVGDVAALGGTLVVSNLSASLSQGSIITVLTANAVGGRFSTTTMPTLPLSLYWRINYGSTQVTAEVTTAAHPDLFVYEGFDYAKPDLQPFNSGVSMVGGSGFTATNAWDGGNYFRTNGLTWTNLYTVGGFASVSNNSLGSIRSLNRMMGTNDSTIWMSFLVRRERGITSDSWNGLAVFSNDSERLFIGHPGTVTNWAIRSYLTPSTNSTAVSQTNPVLMLLKFDCRTSGSDIYAWALPGLPPNGPDELPSPAISITSQPVLNFNRIRLAGNTAATNFLYDEIRLGSSYASVVPLTALKPTNVVDGLYSPGGVGVVGTTNFPGKIVFTNTAHLQIDLGASSYDTMQADLDATLGGTLTVVNVGATLANGNIFTVLTANAVSGQFAATNLPTPPTSLYWKLNYGATMVTLELADWHNPDLIAYEGFNYAKPDIELFRLGVTMNGGVGFVTNAWDGDTQFRTNGLTFTNVYSVGGLASISNAPASYRILNRMMGTNDSTIWMSFLARREAGLTYDRNSGIGLFSNNVAGSERILIGHAGGSSSSATNWGVRCYLGGDFYRYTDVSQTNPVLMLLKLDCRTDGSDVYVWALPGLPPDSSADLPAPAISIPNSPVLNFDRFRLYGQTPATNFFYDEIRMGSTYASVVPLKEAKPTAVIDGLFSPAGAGVVGTTNVPNRILFTNTANVQIDLGAASYDTINVELNATLGGTLTVVNAGATLADLATFNILQASAVSGRFAATNLPSLPSGFIWQVFYTTTNVTLRVFDNNPLNLVQYWGGGTANLADNTPLPLMTNVFGGTWNASLKNWSTSFVPGVYAAFSNRAFANLGVVTNGTASGYQVAIEVKDETRIKGLFADLKFGTAVSGQRILLSNSTPTTVNLVGTNVDFVLTGHDGNRNRRLEVHSNVVLRGSARLNITGTGLLYLGSRSDEVTGPVYIHGSSLNFDSAGGSIGSLAGVPEFHLNRQDRPGKWPDLFVKALVTTGVVDQLHDNASIHMSWARFTYEGRANATHGTDETIRRIVLNGHNFLDLDYTPVNAPDRTQLILADPTNGLDRGVYGRGTLTVVVGSPGNPTNDLVVNNGLPTGQVLPWIGTVRGELMQLNASTKALERVISTQAPSNLAEWVADSDYRLGDETSWEATGTIASDLNIRSLGVMNRTNTTITIADSATLTIGSGGVAFQPRVFGRHLTIAGGKVTTTNSALHFVMGDSNVGADIILNSVIAGEGMDLVKGGVSYLRLGGASNNTYTGTTYVNGGLLRSEKTGSAVAVPGDLVILDGGVFSGLAGTMAISATSKVTVREGGRFQLPSGGVTHGNTLTLAGGEYYFQNAHSATLSAPGTGFIFNGGRVAHDSSHAGYFNLQTDVQYESGATNQARWEVWMPTNAVVSACEIKLNGGIRTFNIADSAYLPAGTPEMVVDMRIVAGSPAGGSLVKTGSGILQLTETNSYTGGTTVNGGVLQVSAINAPAWTGLTASSTHGDYDNKVLTFSQPIARNFMQRQAVTNLDSAGIRPNSAIGRAINDYQVYMYTGSVSNNLYMNNISVLAMQRAGTLGTGSVTNNSGVLLVDAGVRLNNAFTINGGTVTNHGTLNGTLAMNGGVLTGTGTNSFTTITIDGGLIYMNLTGATTINGSISPAGTATGTLNIVGNTTWNSGNSFVSTRDWYFDLGPNSTSDLLNITGDFTKGSGSAFRFDFRGYTGLGTYKLVDWTGTTTFSSNDFTYVNLGNDHVATFQVNGSQLDVVIAECESLPVITLGSSPAVCRGTTSASLSYHSLVSGDKYLIDYSEAANATGFVDVALGTLGASPLSLVVPANGGAGVYTGVLYVVNSASGCRISTNFTVTINVTPAVPGAIQQEGGGSSLCAGSTAIRYSITPVAMATTYTWTPPTGATITSGQGTTSVTVDWSGAAPGSTELKVKAGNDCGTSADRSTGFEILGGIPYAPVLQAETEIALDQFKMNWSAPAAQAYVSVAGYRLDVSTASDFHDHHVIVNGVVASNLALSSGLTSLTLTNLSPGETYYYRMRAYNACGTSTNSESRAMVTPQTIAAWDVSGQTDYGPSPLAPTDQYSGIVVTGLTRGAGLNTGGTAVSRAWGARGWSTANNKTDAIGAGSYFTFSFTPPPNSYLSLYSIDIGDLYRTADGPTNVILQYSLDGVTFTDFGTNTFPVAGQGTSAPGLPRVLTGVEALQNVPGGTTLILRFVNFSATSGDGAWYFYDTGNSTNYDFEIRGNVCSNPPAFTVTGGGVSCNGSSGVAVGLSGSTLGVVYELYRDATTLVSSKAGTGSALSFGLQTVAGTYTVKGIRNAGDCDAAMTGNAVITVVTAPTIPVVTVGEGEEAQYFTPITILETNNNSVVMNWQAPEDTWTSFKVKRRANAEGSYTTIASDVTDTNYTDSTVLTGNTYEYVVSALNGSCESSDSLAATVVMPDNCPVGYAPTLSQPGNKTANVGYPLSQVMIAAEVAAGCTAPTLTNSVLPSGMTISDVVANQKRTRTYQWVPMEGQQGSYPITVTATDTENFSTSVTFVVYVGNNGESGNGSANPPGSQANWSVAITNLDLQSGSDFKLVWKTTPGVSYDVYRASSFPGGSWSLEQGQETTADSSNDITLAHSGDRTYLQVVPTGMTPGTNGVWGILAPAIPVGLSFYAPPVLSDRDLEGDLGDDLAAKLPAGSLIYVLTPGVNATWTTKILQEGGSWAHVSGPALTVLNPGQGIMVNRAVGSSDSPVFTGPVGNLGTSQNSIQVGFNLIGLSEGRNLAAATAFESVVPYGDPGGNQNLSDQVVIQNANGSWRRLIRRSNGLWYDTAYPNASGNTSLILEPGKAYYYIRRSAGGAGILTF